MSRLIVRPPDPRGLPERAVLHAPPAKSVALRALVAASLAGEGDVRIAGPLAEDVAVLLAGLEALGARIAREPGRLRIVSGLDRKSSAPVRISAGDGGAPARFLLAVAATLARPVTIEGSARLATRPMAPLARALAALGAAVSGGPGLPLTVCGPVQGGCRVTVAGDESSQFLSALLLAAPAVVGGLTLAPAGVVVSAPYVDLTRDVMRGFGVPVGPDLAVLPGASYQPTVFAVEPDWSGATVLLSAAAFIDCGVIVPGLSLGSAQPDCRFADVLEALGLEVRAEAGGVLARGRPQRGGVCDLRAFPDSVPALAALAALAPGEVSIRGIAHLRLKESDRIEALAALLAAMGVRCTSSPEALIVRGPWSSKADQPATAVTTRGDHRMAMAAALLGLRQAVAIDDPACVAKSFPGFFEQWPGVTPGGG